MASFPTITLNSSAVGVTTASGSLSYEQILYSLNQTAYRVKKLDIQANNISQLSEPLTYTKPDADGILFSESFVPAVDSYQFLASLNNLKTDFIIQALMTLQFTLQPFETVNFMFYADFVTFEKLLHKDSIDELNKTVNDSKKEKNKSVDNGDTIIDIIVLGGVIFTVAFVIKKLFKK